MFKIISHWSIAINVIIIIFFSFSAAQVWKEVQQDKTTKKGTTTPSTN